MPQLLRYRLKQCQYRYLFLMESTITCEADVIVLAFESLSAIISDLLFKEQVTLYMGLRRGTLSGASKTYQTCISFAVVRLFCSRGPFLSTPPTVLSRTMPP